MKEEGSNANEIGGQDRAPRDTNITAYTQRFHELVLLCPEKVPTEKKKVEAYIKGQGRKGFRGKQKKMGKFTRLNTRDTNLFVTTARNITTAITGQLVTTAEGRVFLRKTVGGSRLQFVMDVEKGVTPRTIVQKRRTLKVKRLGNELM
nr:hypothetical protein [Tanacetum cinerariifolium]